MKEIGATNAFAFDLDAACSSFLFGMSVVARYIESGIYKKVLLIGADKNSSMINYEDRATCIIFGDGAGAVLFEPNHEGFGVKDEYLRSDGSGREFLRATHGGSSNAITEESLKENSHFVFQDGKTVFKNAVFNMADAAEKILKRNDLDNDKMDWLGGMDSFSNQYFTAFPLVSRVRHALEEDSLVSMHCYTH